MKNIYWVNAIRMAITIFILIQVWRNAHWSVALAITGISIAIEGLTFAVDRLSKGLRAHLEAIRRGIQHD